MLVNKNTGGFAVTTMFKNVSAKERHTVVSGHNGTYT
jgi:hypothetical protein